MKDLFENGRIIETMDAVDQHTLGNFIVQLLEDGRLRILTIEGRLLILPSANNCAILEAKK